MVNYEKAEGDVPADAWGTAVIKVGCLLLIGIVIVTGIVQGANITSGSPMYGMEQSVLSNFNSGYALASLLVLVIGAAAVMTFLGFM